MKSFKDYIETTDADVAREYMGLHRKNKEGPLNPFDELKLKAMKSKLEDPMIKHRMKVDAAGLVPTRTGSKGGDGGGSGGNGNGN